MQQILGISAYYHDSAAALVAGGKIVAAVQQERFSRIKHDPAFPAEAIVWCLSAAGTSLRDVDAVVFYDKPWLKFERLLESYLANAPHGFRSFVAAMPIWMRDKLHLKKLLRDELAAVGDCKVAGLPELLFTEHHQAHAASAFFPSPFERAAVLCMDGVGEWATTSVWSGESARLKPLWEIQFPHSLGLLYSAFTYYTGFKVNSGEYKLMGLAPYGEPEFADTIREHLVQIADDGTFRLDMRYFEYVTGLTMTSKHFHRLFGGPPRQPESALGQREMNLASSVQQVIEDIVLKIARTVRAETDHKNLCLAGGVALNCVANGRLVREAIFDDIWIQPAAGDAGGAVGAALAAWHLLADGGRQVVTPDGMRGAFLGPQFATDDIVAYLDGEQLPYRRCDDDALYTETCARLAAGEVVGWFQGPMEFGPRALGNRSILGDPRNPEMQRTLNLKIKYRESFRPFAPAVLAEKQRDCFALEHASPYMLLTADVAPKIRLPADDGNLHGFELLASPRSTLPAVTHVDYSARVQTVHADTNPRFHRLLQRFDETTGCPVLVNTSFNVRGEPIVCTPRDAYRCFMSTGMDSLVMGNCLLDKTAQPAARTIPHEERRFAPD